MFLLIGLHLPPLDGHRDTQFMRQRRDVICIGIGFSAAQQVVEVSDMKLYSQSFTEAGQYVNQAYRVRPAGDTYYQEFISPDQIVFPDKPKDPSWQRLLATHWITYLKWQVSLKETSTALSGLNSRVHMEATSNLNLLQYERSSPSVLQIMHIIGKK